MLVMMVMEVLQGRLLAAVSVETNQAQVDCE